MARYSSLLLLLVMLLLSLSHSLAMETVEEEAPKKEISNTPPQPQQQQKDLSDEGEDDDDEEEEDDSGADDDNFCGKALMRGVLQLVEPEKEHEGGNFVTRNNGCALFQKRAAKFVEGNVACIDYSQRWNSRVCAEPETLVTRNGDKLNYVKSATGSDRALTSIFDRFESAAHVFAVVDAEQDVSNSQAASHSFAVFKHNKLYYIVSAYGTAFLPQEWWTGTFEQYKGTHLGSFWTGLGKVPSDGLTRDEFRSWLTAMAVDKTVGDNGETIYPGNTLWVAGAQSSTAKNEILYFHGSKLELYFLNLPKTGHCFHTSISPSQVQAKKQQQQQQQDSQKKTLRFGAGFKAKLAQYLKSQKSKF